MEPRSDEQHHHFQQQGGSQVRATVGSETRDRAFIIQWEGCILGQSVVYH
jgi:hypothetical protein